MKRTVEDWSVEKLNKNRDKISFPEYQREKSLWPPEKKSMLIDSILRDIDIPKLYFNRLKDGSLEVIDGQQRLWSIWEFLNGDFPYKINSRNYHFSQLTPAQKKRISDYNLQITVFEEADDDYLRELFVRLQLGLLLNTGEKLHAAKGMMKDLVFTKLANHALIKHLGIPARRYAKQTLCAQICINAFSREKNKAFARTRYDDLINFFAEYSDPQGKDLEFFRAMSKSIAQELDRLWDCFGADTGQLKNRSYILSVYLFVQALLEKGVFSKDEQQTFKGFAFKLWKRLREEMKLGIDRKNRELYSFQTLLNSAPGEPYQIERRHEKLGEYYEHYRKTKKIKGDK